MFYLIATTSLSRKNINKYGKEEGAQPQILKQGTFDDCAGEFKKMFGRSCSGPAEWLPGLPVASNETWIYWLIEGPSAS